MLMDHRIFTLPHLPISDSQFSVAAQAWMHSRLIDATDARNIPRYINSADPVPERISVRVLMQSSPIQAADAPLSRTVPERWLRAA